MISYLLLALGTITTYTFLTFFFKKTLQAKYEIIKSRAKQATLNNQDLYLEKNQQIKSIEVQIDEMSKKAYTITMKNISDEHYYRDEIIADYKQEQSIAKKKASKDDDEKSGSSNKENITKNSITSSYPSHLK